MRNYLFKMFNLIFIYAYNMFVTTSPFLPHPPISLYPPTVFSCWFHTVPFLLAMSIKVRNLTLKVGSSILWALVQKWIKNELVEHNNSSSFWLQMHCDWFPQLCCHEFITKVVYTLKMQVNVKPVSQNYFCQGILP